jgi:hypothetical protein
MNIFKRMPTQDELDRGTEITQHMRDYEAYVASLKTAPFKEIQTDYGSVFFAEVGTRYRLVVDGDEYSRPVCELPLGPRIKIYDQIPPLKNFIEG